MMNTFNIGEEPEILVPIHVQSSRLESRAEFVGNSSGSIIHARSYNDSRRIVIASGLANPSSVTEFLNELPELPAADLMLAIVNSMNRNARVLKNATDIGCRVLSVRGKQLEWAGIGHGLLAIKLYKQGKVIWPVARKTNDDIYTGFYKISSKDQVLGWTGFGLGEKEFTALEMDPYFRSLPSCHGCLVTLLSH